MTNQSTSPSQLRKAHERYLRRWWRIAFIIYALALTTATHWPQLQLPPSAPTSDKMLHMGAFGILAVLLWKTQWIRSRLATFIVAMAWAMLDEWSQAIPALNRWCTLEDAAANAMGVSVVGAWLWSMQPVGLDTSRRRTALRQYAADRIFARTGIWMLALLTIISFGVIAALLWSRIDVIVMRRVLLGMAAAGPLIIWIAAYNQWDRELKRIETERPCFRCGRGAVNPSPNSCDACGSVLDPQQWTEARLPDRSVLLRAAVTPTVLVLLIVGGVFAIVFASPTAYAWMLQAGETWSGAPRAVRAVGRAGRGMINAVDLTFYLLVFAVAARVFRRGLARYFDQAIRCRRCGHDVRATPVDEVGDGVCPECGTTFIAGQQA